MAQQREYLPLVHIKTNAIDCSFAIRIRLLQIPDTETFTRRLLCFEWGRYLFKILLITLVLIEEVFMLFFIDQHRTTSVRPRSLLSITAPVVTCHTEADTFPHTPVMRQHILQIPTKNPEHHSIEQQHSNAANYGVVLVRHIPVVKLHTSAWCFKTSNSLAH